MFHVVLVEPEIPPNTGNVGRLCLAADSVLHLVEPLGFSLDDRSLRRAGLDYWAEVNVRTWPGIAALRASVPSGAAIHFLTTKSTRPYWGAAFRPGDYLVFGRESRGLPESLLRENPEQCLTIPMKSTRSLNLATAVGIVLFEAMRQQAVA